MAASTIRRSTCLAVVVSVLGLFSPRAFAQSSDPAAAEALFEAGRAAFESGDYDAACAKFAESHRLDPAAGTLINLAACNERRGRLASAWENWREALSLLRADDERLPGVEKRKADLEARLPRLEVSLDPAAPQNSHVTRDGVALGPAALGLPLPVDPGAHRVEVVAEGRTPKTYEVVAEEGRVTKLVVEPGPPRIAVRRQAPVAAPAPLPRKAPSKTDDGRPIRLVGYTAIGVGLASLGVGTVTGLMALERKQTIVDRCDERGDRYVCPDEGVDAARSGKTLATLSSITTIAGLGLAATGLVLVLTSPSSEINVALSLTPSGGMLGGRGRF